MIGTTARFNDGISRGDPGCRVIVGPTYYIIQGMSPSQRVQIVNVRPSPGNYAVDILRNSIVIIDWNWVHAKGVNVAGRSHRINQHLSCPRQQHVIPIYKFN